MDSAMTPLCRVRRACSAFFAAIIKPRPIKAPYTREFYDAVVKEGWRVNQIVPGHGRLAPWQELADALSKAE